MEQGETMSDAEFVTAGGNHSLIHLDFMIGSGAMNVDALAEDGMVEPIMRNGEWAFEA
jgi:aminopeptidase